MRYLSWALTLAACIMLTSLLSCTAEAPEQLILASENGNEAEQGASNLSSVSVSGPEINLIKPPKGKGKGNAKTKKMVVADRVISIQTGVEAPDDAAQTSSLRIVGRFGTSPTNLGLEATLVLDAGSDILDFSDDIVFAFPYLPPAAQNGQYYLEMDFELFDAAGASLWQASLDEYVSEDMVRFMGETTLSLDGEAPAYTSPEAPGPNGLTYSDVLFHDLGVAYHVQTPATAAASITDASFELVLNGNTDHHCSLQLKALSGTIDLDGAADLIWMPYPQISGQTIEIVSAEIQADILPTSLGLTDLILLDNAVETAAGAVVISVE
ncbi:MAG: hypothetical protein AAF206_11815 [Bacteroidota bacterium]